MIYLPGQGITQLSECVTLFLHFGIEGRLLLARTGKEIPS